MQSPIEVVQRHCEAYNSHDLAAFAACFSDTVQIFRSPVAQPVISNKAQLIHFYENHRFNLPNLKAELLNRIIIGNKVIDHERVFGLEEKPVEAAIVNEVINGLIQNVWIYL